MSFTGLLWALFIAWFIACLFYLWKIIMIFRGRSRSLFSSLSKLSGTSRHMVKRLYFNIAIATFILLAALIVAYVVSRSS